MSSGKLKFISNNAKEIQKSKKGIKKFEYLKNSISPNGSIFLLERHSSIDDGKRWFDEFNGNFHFSHGKTNSCGVAIEYIQWNLYKPDTIGAEKSVLYRDVRFIEIPYKNKYLAKINQEWVFQVNGFHRVKEGHVNVMKKVFISKITSKMLLLQHKNQKSITLIF